MTLAFPEALSGCEYPLITYTLFTPNIVPPAQGADREKNKKKQSIVVGVHRYTYHTCFCTHALRITNH